MKYRTKLSETVFGHSRGGSVPPSVQISEYTLGIELFYLSQLHIEV